MLTVATTGEKVREARRRAMLTQGELAEKSGVGITSIVRIERDQLDTLRASRRCGSWPQPWTLTRANSWTIKPSSVGRGPWPWR